MQQAASNNPYNETDGKLLHFYFCNETPAPDLDKFNRFKSATESFQLIDKVLYIHAPQGIGCSKLVNKVEQCLGVSATGRNLNTVNKLLEILGQYATLESVTTQDNH